MADGSVIIKVDADTKRAQTELAKLERGLQKTAAEMEKTGSERNAIADQLNEASSRADETRQKVEILQKTYDDLKTKTTPGKGAESDPMKFLAYQDQLPAVSEQLTAQKKILEGQNKEVDKLTRKFQGLDAKLQQQTAEYDAQQETVGQMRSQLMQSGGRGMEQLKAGVASATQSLKVGFKTVLKYAFGIRSIYILFRKLRAALKEGFLAYAAQDPETKANIDSLKASLNGLKLAWGAAFAPVVNAVIPYLVKLIDWLTSASNAIAQFFAVLSGNKTYKKIQKNMNSVAGAAGGAGDAAEEAKKQIMGFDEINRLDDNKSGGNGGGGGGSGLGDAIEEAVNLQSFPARLAMAVDDVLFDWTDLNAEQIAEKCLAGFVGLGGAIAGGMIGGVPGAIIGLALGLLLGCILDASIFNFDGELSTEEFFKALGAGLPVGMGLIIGAATGGPLGAAIGLALGLVVSFVVIKWEDIKPKIDTWYQGVKDYFQQYIDKWGEWASEDSKKIGFNIVMGILEGIFWKLADFGKWCSENLIKPIVNTVKDLLGIHSPSTVFAEIGADIVSGLLQGLKDKWNTVTQWFHSVWDRLSGWWNSLSLGAFHIPVPHFEWTYSQAEGIIARALEFVGLPATIPHLNISWFAKGGIVNGATIFGAGEAGREAIVPLERNTGWLKRVAEEILDAMGSKYTGALSGMPAMAMGGIAPPRAVNSSGSMFSDGDIERLVSGITAAFGMANGENVTKLYLDGRQIAEAVTKHQKNMSRGTGA